MSRPAGAAPVAPDHLVRRQALDTAKSFIVQAPAGSGKTELLIQRFLALLGAVRHPESILAITFTRKAAGEMRERVLHALDSAARGEPARDANHGFTLQLAMHAGEQDARYGWQLRHNPARLRIQTVDALCAGITSRMPWLSRFGGQPQVVEDATELYAEAATRTVELLEDESGLSEAVAQLGLHLDNDLRRLRTMLQVLLARRDQWLRHLGGGIDREELRPQLKRTIELAIEPKLRALRAAVPTDVAISLAKSFQYAGANLGWPECHGLPGTSAEHLHHWHRIADLLLTEKGEWRKSVTVTHGFPAGAKAEKGAMTVLLARLSREETFRQLLCAVCDLPSPTLPERQWEALEALCLILPAAAAQLKLVFLDRRQVDFIEIAEAARRALGTPEVPTDLALYFGERLQHILLDEAQDTSISQMQLLERLVAGWDLNGQRTVFVVGDPMQSIYRFREADVGLFLKLRRQGVRELKLEPLQLIANFRTRPSITEWVNRSFDAIFPAEENVATGAVAYAPSEPTREAARTATVEVHPFFDPDMDLEAVAVADLVEQSRSGRTAILVRARTHAVAIVEELQRRGLPFRAVDLDPLDTRPVVGDLIALTRALLHIADRTAWLAILRAPWCGLPLRDLLEISNTAGRGTILDALSTVSSPAGASPTGTPPLPGRDREGAVFDLFSNTRAGAITQPERIVHLRDTMLRGLARVRRAPLREVVEQTWMELGGPSCLRDDASAEDARRLFSLLERHEQAGELTDVTMLETHAAKLFAQPDPKADGSLEIMTIHKAKGLEFDTVIVPGLGRGPGRDRRPLLRWCEIETEEGSRLLLAPVEAMEDDRDPLYEYLRKLEAEKARHESVRLLYVAATRARERLHLLGHVRQKDGKMYNPFSGSLLELLWPVVRPQFESEFANLKPSLQLGLQFTGLRQTMWRLAAVPRPSAAAPAPEPATPDPSQIADLERAIGTITHGFLDRMARQGIGWWQAMGGAQRSTVIESVAHAHGVPEADLAAVTAQVSRILDSVCLSPRAQWILAPRDSAATELALGAGGNRHVIDRTFIEDGTRWIIDYKTGSGLGYREQLERYGRILFTMEALPVRLGVYFPATDQWEEWALNI
ncbi:MAG: UvrD-helicase domain-containing protein [Bryobacterales bacterium]|nr:UvrD-helicase domain-containing protein [Bryobacterales bacterium]